MPEEQVKLNQPAGAKPRGIELWARYLAYGALVGVVLALLLGAGLLFQCYRVVNDYSDGACAKDVALARLGGKRAPLLLGIYYRLGLSRELRPAIVTLLGNCGQAALPALHRAVTDRDATVREDAINGLVANESDERLLIEVLGKVLKDDPDPEVRRTCVYGLEKCGVDAAPALIAALTDRYEPLREDAAAALGELGPSAVPPLVAALRSPHASQRQGAADALGGIRSADEAVVSGLRALLDDPDESVRAAAASGLGRIGMQAIAARDALIVMMAKDRSPRVRGCCVLALGRIAPDVTVVVEEVANRLADPDASVRMIAASTLGKIGASAREGNALANLSACLSDRSPGVRAFAAVAIARIDPDRRTEMMILLQKQARESDPPCRYAQEALDELERTRRSPRQ